MAQEVDPGFDVNVFVEMIGSLTRYSDVDLALGEVDVAALRQFFRRWGDELRGV